MHSFRYTTLVDGNNVIQSVDLIIQADNIRDAWKISSDMMDAMGIARNDRVNPDVKLIKKGR